MNLINTMEILFGLSFDLEKWERCPFATNPSQGVDKTLDVDPTTASLAHKLTLIGRERNT